MPKTTAQLSLVEPQPNSPSLPERVSKALNAIRNSEYYRPQTKENHSYVSGLICPDCGELEAWIRKDRPWLLICNRQNNCGAVIKTRDVVHIEPFREFDYPSTQDDPHAPATNYLKVERALDKVLEGLKYTYNRNIRKTGSGGVMFHVGVNPEGIDVWNGRLFSPPPGESKTHNTPGKSIRGMVWSHPGIAYDPEKDTFITEGIINALSLIEMGYQAIAILASNQIPENVDLSPWPKRVFAFDNDDAGAKATKRWMKAHPDASAVLPPKGYDWNDLLLGSTPIDAGQDLAKNRSRYELYAALAITDKADDYVLTYYGFYGRNPGLFRMERRYFYGVVKEKKDGEREVVCSSVSNFIVHVRYYELSDQNPDEPDNRYAIRILPETGRPTDCIVSAGDLAAPNQMTKMFLQRARVLWKGERSPTLSLVERIVSAKAPVVRQVQSIGFDHVSGWYVHPQFAIDKDGRLHKPDKAGFFEVRPNNLVRPTRDPDVTAVLPKPGQNSPSDIYHKVNEAWPNKGPAAMAWTMAAWWVNQIKDTIGFFPHCSFFKDSQTGKSNLSVILHKIQCMDTEGIPLNRSTTVKGLVRKIGQRSGCIVGLLESNSSDRASLNYSDLVLTTYNKNPLQTRAKTTNDLQTHDIPNRAALLFVQNVEPFRTKQERERVISLMFSDSNVNEDTRFALNDLKRIPATDFANVYAVIMKQRKMVEDRWMDKMDKAKLDLSEIQDSRIIENHAVVLAFHRLLCEIIGVSGAAVKDVEKHILHRGIQKKTECAQNIGEEADMFFDTLFQLDGNNHDVIANFILKDNKYVVINLPGILRVMSQIGFDRFDKRRLQDDLRAHPAFIPEESNKSYRFWVGSEQKVKKGWCFDVEKCRTDNNVKDQGRLPNEC